jgi:hypothetical protein
LSESNIPVHALLERGDFYDVVPSTADEMASAAM